MWSSISGCKGNKEEEVSSESPSSHSRLRITDGGVCVAIEEEEEAEEDSGTGGGGATKGRKLLANSLISR